MNLNLFLITNQIHFISMQNIKYTHQLLLHAYYVILRKYCNPPPYSLQELQTIENHKYIHNQAACAKLVLSAIFQKYLSIGGSCSPTPSAGSYGESTPRGACCRGFEENPETASPFDEMHAAKYDGENGSRVVDDDWYNCSDEDGLPSKVVSGASLKPLDDEEEGGGDVERPPAPANRLRTFSKWTQPRISMQGQLLVIGGIGTHQKAGA